MPFCPECEYEYLPSIKKCPDCDMDLVESLPDRDNMPEVNWKPLRDLPGNLYAEMVKEVLDNVGIPSIIKSDVLTSTYGAKSVSMPGSSAQIYVPEEHHDRCRQILLDMMDHI